MPISEDRADRIEAKVDGLILAVNRLAVIDERQIEAGKRVGALEDRLAKLEERQEVDQDFLKDKINEVDAKVNKWVNMGIGAWAIVVTLYAIYNTFRPVIH